MNKLYIHLVLAAMTLVLGAQNARAIALPDGVEAQTWSIEGQYYSSSDGFQNAELVTQAAFDGNDVYLKGLSKTFPNAWVKGTLDPETGLVTFANSQVLGKKVGKTHYLIGSADGTTECDIVFKYDAAKQTLICQTLFVFEITEHTSPINSYELFWMSIIYYAGEPVEPQPVEVPEGLVTTPWTFTGNELYGDAVTFEMRVGFDGRDVYFLGFTGREDAPYWAKGTLSDDGTTVTIPSVQYLGQVTRSSTSYDCYLTAANEANELTDLVLNYDAEAGTFTTDQLVALNTRRFRLSVLSAFTDVVITKVNLNAATPVDPTILYFDGINDYPNIQFEILAEDIDGNPLDTDNFFYTLWVEKDGTEQPLVLTAELYDSDFDEDMVEIPYTFTGYEVYEKGELVYLRQGVEEMTTWTKIGVQSIYREGEKEGRSNIVWMDLDGYWEPVGIATAAQDKAQSTVYDLSGRRVGEVKHERNTHASSRGEGVNLHSPLSRGFYIIGGRKVLLK